MNSEYAISYYAKLLFKTVKFMNEVRWHAKFGYQNATHFARSRYVVINEVDRKEV